MRLFPVGTLLVPGLVLGQATAPVVVRVRVIDSASRAVAEGDASIARGLNHVVARATTNAAGEARLSVARAPGDLELVVRKVGFLPARRFFTLGEADTAAFTLIMSHAAATLPAVRVTAAEDLKRKNYHVGADDIENSSRTLIDGTDLFKLRPNMLNSRGGVAPCLVPGPPGSPPIHTGWIESVWINGQRVILPPLLDDALLDRARSAVGIPAMRADRGPSSLRGRATRIVQRVTSSPVDTVLSILATIHPEHIEEVTYHDCFDTSVEKTHGDMAMFIVLKPGIGFQPGIGSYVVDTKKTVADSPRTVPARADSSSLQVGALPSYRFRLLGVFDELSGDPVAGVEVTDVATGLTARTTATGTVALFFVPEGNAALRLRQQGFRDTTVAIHIGPSDTIPITVPISRKP